MTTLTAWKFDTPTGAAEAEDRLRGLASEKLIEIHDAAVVSWPEGKKRPKTKQLQSLTGMGALDGGFWGLLFGLIFFVPFLGMAMGAALGALSGSMVDVGIDDGFIDAVRSEVTPGTSALFLLTSEAVQDRISDVFGDGNAHLVSSNLSREQESQLRATFEAA